MGLISTFFDKKISLGMSDLIEEEIGHYCYVIRILDKINLTSEREGSDDFVKSLLSFVNINEPRRMIDDN